VTGTVELLVAQIAFRRHSVWSMARRQVLAYVPGFGGNADVSAVCPITPRSPAGRDLGHLGALHRGAQVVSQGGDARVEL
jgi:hypothetical protein